MEIYGSIFLLLAIFALVMQRDKPTLFMVILYILGVVILVGMRASGVDNDYVNYVADFQGRGEIAEFSFKWISSIIRSWGGEVIVLFLCYALIGITVKILTLYRYSPLFCLSLLIYYTTSFVSQDMNAIRAGAATAMMCLSFTPWIEGRRLECIIWLLLATFFHYSFVILLPLAYLCNNRKEELRWYLLLIPLSYIFYYTIDPVAILSEVNLNYISQKLISYQGQEFVFSPYTTIYILRIIIILLLFAFKDELADNFKCFTLFFKLYIIGFFLLLALGSLPVVSSRFSEIFTFMEILLIPMLLTQSRSLYFGISIGIVYSLIYFILNIFIAAYIRDYSMTLWN